MAGAGGMIINPSSQDDFLYPEDPDRFDSISYNKQDADDVSWPPPYPALTLSRLLPRCSVSAQMYAQRVCVPTLTHTLSQSHFLPPLSTSSLPPATRVCLSVLHPAKVLLLNDSKFHGTLTQLINPCHTILPHSSPMSHNSLR